jgi:hypothetical protein
MLASNDVWKRDPWPPGHASLRGISVPSRTNAKWVVGLVMAAMLSTACGETEPRVKVTNIQVGRSRNNDRTIARQTFEFHTTDTMHAAVVVEGRRGARVSVKARWTMPGGMISESEQSLVPRERAIAPFELRSAGGFPPGKYLLEIFMDGASVGIRELTVR